MTTGSFCWHPTIYAKADRNRKRVRIGFAFFGLFFGALVVASQVRNGLPEMLFALASPVLFLPFALAMDLSYRDGRQFQILVEHGQLTVSNGKKTLISLPASSIANITLKRSTVANHQNDWFLLVDTDSGREFTQIPNGSSIIFGQAQAAGLEKHLRKLLVGPVS